MTTLEQVIQTADTLPLEDRRRLLRHLQQGLQEPESFGAADPSRAEKLRRELEEYRRANQWIAAHRAEYLGQWVALEGDRLISHGADAKQVHDDARAEGIQTPFVVHIAEEPTHYIGGFEICR